MFTLPQTILKILKPKAHALKPVILLGAKGLTEAVHTEIETALIAHELIKIKLQAPDKLARQTMASAICQQHHAQLVQLIGNKLTIYRESTDLDKK